MDYASNDLCLAMEEVRKKGQRDAVTIHESLETLFDWRSYVTRHPLLALGGAAVLGLIVAPKATKRLTAPELEVLAGRLSVAGSAADGALTGKGNAFARYVLPVVAMAGPPLARIAVAGILAKFAATEQPQAPVEAEYD